MEQGEGFKKQNLVQPLNQVDDTLDLLFTFGQKLGFS